MLYESGFYKYDNNQPLLYAKSFVKAPEYTLLAEEKTSYVYPVNGWYWFNTLEEACEFFNIDPTPYTQSIEEPQE